MNEQLQAALIKLIQQISSGAATASSQLPEALQQYVAYARESSIKMMVICFGAAAVLLVLIFMGWLRSRRWHNDYEFLYFVMFIIAAVSAGFGVAYYNQYIQTFYPQAFILDMLRGTLSN